MTLANSFEWINKMNKQTCKTCQKTFLSVYVTLKAFEASGDRGTMGNIHAKTHAQIERVLKQENIQK